QPEPIPSAGATDQSGDLARGDGPVHKAERAVLLHLARGAEQRGERNACQCTTHAYALRADSRKLIHVKVRALHSGQDVDRPVYRAYQRRDLLYVRNARRIENVCSGFLKGLQAIDSVSKILATVEIVLRPCCQHEWERQIAHLLRRRTDAIDRMLE